MNARQRSFKTPASDVVSIKCAWFGISAHVRVESPAPVQRFLK